MKDLNTLCPNLLQNHSQGTPIGKLVLGSIQIKLFKKVINPPLSISMGRKIINSLKYPVLTTWVISKQKIRFLTLLLKDSWLQPLQIYWIEILQIVVWAKVERNTRERNQTDLFMMLQNWPLRRSQILYSERVLRSQGSCLSRSFQLNNHTHILK